MITSISRPGHNILHMDYYIEGNWIYWVDYEEDQNNGIFRVRPDGSDKQHIIKVSSWRVFSGIIHSLEKPRGRVVNVVPKDNINHATPKAFSKNTILYNSRRTSKLDYLPANVVPTDYPGECTPLAFYKHWQC